MAHLVEIYSRTTGLRIERMKTYEQFFPLTSSFDKYILVCTGSGMGGKNYSYFADVLWVLREPLKKAGYKIIQVGGKDDERIGADLDACGATSKYQYFYLVKNAKLVLCNDSSILHLAGHYDVPVVTLFGLTDPKISGAYFGSDEKKIHLTADLDGAHPSFNPSEKPKKIDRIEPERVTEAVAKLLKLKTDTLESLYIGDQYRFQAIEVVPDHLIDPSNFTRSLLNIRYDYGGEENICYAYLSQRKCNIITNKPLNVDILSQLLPNISTIIYEIDENHDVAFVEKMHRAGVPYVLISYLAPDKLSEFKLAYSDFHLINPKTYKTKADVPDADKVTPSSVFRSSKYLLSQGKIYLSRAHLNAQVAIENFENNLAPVLDTDEFWKEIDFFYLFNRKVLK